MNNKVYIEGMGLSGCLLALFLNDEGTDFEWYDNNNNITAWKASTGCVYPTGDPEEWKSYQFWNSLIYSKDTTFPNISKFLRENKITERGIWVYSGKNPPHLGNKTGVGPVESFNEDTLHISNTRTIHFNIQKLVEAVRELFEDKRIDAPPKNPPVRIVTHGTASAEKFTWGWSMLVKPTFHDIFSVSLTNYKYRPCLYLRKVYDMTYMYPKPGTKWYYAGTSTISQREPKSLETSERSAKWPTKLEELTGGLVTCENIKPNSLVEGWRPVAAEGTPWCRKVKTKSGLKLILKPMSGNGIRMFPKLFLETLDVIINARNN